MRNKEDNRLRYLGYQPKLYGVNYPLAVAVYMVQSEPYLAITGPLPTPSGTDSASDIDFLNLISKKLEEINDKKEEMGEEKFAAEETLANLEENIRELLLEAYQFQSGVLEENEISDDLKDLLKGDNKNAVIKTLNYVLTLLD